MQNNVLFLLDVDNTLLNNDAIKMQIKKSLIDTFGEEEAITFWQEHDSFRDEHNLVDFPTIIKNYCKTNHADSCDTRLSQIFFGIDFVPAMFHKAFETIEHLKTLGTVCIFTEGDAVYQKRKVEQSGLAEVVNQVYLFDHKLDHIEEVTNGYPDHDIIFVDDKVENLKKFKSLLPESKAVSVVEVCQGHYAKEDHVQHDSIGPVVDNISDLLSWSYEDFFKTT